MRLCRYDDNRVGVVEGDVVIDVTPVTDTLPAVRWPLPIGDLLIANLDHLMPRIKELAKTGARKPVSSVHLLSPVANPGKIMGFGQAYKAHVEEAMKDPLMSRHVPADPGVSKRMMVKANTSLVGPSEGVALRFLDQRTDPELEFAIVFGRKGTNVPKERAFEMVAGYAIGFDMSLRGPAPPSSRKSIDSYSVLGPWMVTSDEIPNPDDVAFTLRVNGEIRQQATTRDLIFSIATQIEHAASFYTLYPGDILMTGTPEGVAQVRPGDVMEAEMAGIGKMTVKVRAHVA